MSCWAFATICTIWRDVAPNRFHHECAGLVDGAGDQAIARFFVTGIDSQ